MQQLVKAAGVHDGIGRGRGHALKLRGIRTIDSAAFSPPPLAVEPGSSYRVSFALSGELPTGGEAGVDLLEYDTFLWIGDRLTQSLSQKHQVRAQECLASKS